MRAALPRYLEVELGTYCNWRCAWCPNGWHDRGQAREVMPVPLWTGLLADLAENGFAGFLAFHNYNEPLADPRLHDRLAEARAALPGARLDVHTNGDFLDARALERLRRGGLDAVEVTPYPASDAALAAPAPARIDAFLARVGVARGGLSRPPPRNVERVVRVGRLVLNFRVPNVAGHHARAGAVGFAPLRAQVPRTAPCHIPARSPAPGRRSPISPRSTRG